MFNVQCINTDGSVCREGEEKGRGERKEQIYFKRTNNYLQLEEVMLLIAHSALEIKSDTFATISSDFLPSLHSVQKNKVMIISLSPSLPSPFPLSRPLPSSLSTLPSVSPLPSCLCNQSGSPSRIRPGIWRPCRVLQKDSSCSARSSNCFSGIYTTDITSIDTILFLNTFYH